MLLLLLYFRIVKIGQMGIKLCCLLTQNVLMCIGRDCIAVSVCALQYYLVLSIVLSENSACFQVATSNRAKIPRM